MRNLEQEMPFLEVSCNISFHCAVPGHNHTPPQKGILNFHRGVEGSLKKSLLYGRYGYFLNFRYSVHVAAKNKDLTSRIIKSKLIGSSVFIFRFTSCFKFNYQGIDTTVPYSFAGSFCRYNLCNYWGGVVYGSSSQDMLRQCYR